jgi:hypothetical protein
MGIPILMGRDFTEADSGSAPRGVVISQAMARHYFGDRNPVGHRIWFPEDKDTPTTIIGVAGDFLIGGPREASHQPGYTYFSYRDREAPRRLRSMMMAVRSNESPGELSQRIRAELQGPPLALPISRSTPSMNSSQTCCCRNGSSRAVECIWRALTRPGRPWSLRRHRLCRGAAHE